MARIRHRSPLSVTGQPREWIDPRRSSHSWAGPARTALLILVLLVITPRVGLGQRLTYDFNLDWKFAKSDPQGAAAVHFDDQRWASVSTPHTFNDTDTFDDWSAPGHRGEFNQWAGRTWYRKSFAFPASFRGRKVFLEFEGARQVAEVYLNGRLLGVSKNGFIPFGFDLTPFLDFNATNVVAVRCDNRFMKDPELPADGKRAGKGENGGPSLAEISARVNAVIPESADQVDADQIPWNNPHWHPAHGGLYRNVRLYVTDPLHISLPLYSFLETTGPYVYATGISNGTARVGIEVPVQNDRVSSEQVELLVEVYDPEGKSVLELRQATPVTAGARRVFEASGVLQNARLWEPEYPCLYRVVCSLNVAGTAVDSCEIPLGLRIAEWDAQKGLSLNGHPLKLHGWGQKPTDEWPGLGAAQPDWLHFYTIDLMKQGGGNFVRWGHCAGPPASIMAADRLGILVDQPGVDGESDTRGGAWAIRAAAFRDMLIYYRNHPSILIWEGGNQKVSRAHASELSGYVARYDPHGGRAYAHRRADQVTAEFMQVAIGTEGGREIAALPVVEGEYDREESPRRVWDTFSRPHFGYPEAAGQTYQLTSEQYAVNQVVQYVSKPGAANHCGGANWIFSDSTSGGRVGCEVARASGEVDGVRLPKEAYYACQAMFRSAPQVHIIGHWTYSEGTRKAVYVVSNGEAVELWVNGKSLGRGQISDRFLFSFGPIAWETGEIRAVAYRGGVAVASQAKKTVGRPAGLRLKAITREGGLRADGSDVVLVDVEAVDAQGERCPTFQQPVNFEVKGPGVWRGGYNSGKTNSINRTVLDLECGVNRVAIRATREPGTISLVATCPSLRPASLNIDSIVVAVHNGLAVESARIPTVPLGARPRVERSAPEPGLKTSSGSKPVSGRFTTAFSYSGPARGVRVEQDAQPGKRVYLDRDAVFGEMPAELTGADWVRAADADRRYSAVDLMEVAVADGTTVFIAHDDRLERPDWLATGFTPAGFGLSIGGKPMSVFRHKAVGNESLSLGANARDAAQQACNMYVVFVQGASTRSSKSPIPIPAGAP